MSSQPESIQILLVEDNPADVDLTQERMLEAKISNKIHVVEDGEQAIDFLRKKPPYESAPTPDLILLDLNLPKMDGRDVLREMKGDPELAVIPTVVLTSSEAEEDIMRSYSLSANAYIRKPINLAGYREIVASIDGFWLSLVKFPLKTTESRVEDPRQ